MDDLNEIKLYFHCKECMENIPEDLPLCEYQTEDLPLCEYQNISCGWTANGLQVWCNRHEKNIIHIDFEGHQFKAK